MFRIPQKVAVVIDVGLSVAAGIVLAVIGGVLAYSLFEVLQG